MKPNKLLVVSSIGVFERLVLTDWVVTFRVSSIPWEGLEADIKYANLVGTGTLSSMGMDMGMCQSDVDGLVAS